MKNFETFPIFIIDKVNNEYNHFEVPAEMITADASTWAAYFEAAQELINDIADTLCDVIEQYVHEHSGCSCTLDELDALIERKESE